jgi:hypothetical protein
MSENTTPKFGTMPRPVDHCPDGWKESVEFHFQMTTGDGHQCHVTAFTFSTGDRYAPRIHRAESHTGIYPDNQYGTAYDTLAEALAWIEEQIDKLNENVCPCCDGPIHKGESK